MIRTLALTLMFFVTLSTLPAPVAAQDQAQQQPAAADAPQAEPPIATVIDVEGDNNVILRAAENGKSYPAQVNAPVYRNDVLLTGSAAGSRMLVVFLDDSRFTLGENSKFTADEYSYDDTDNTNNKARYSVLRGAFLYTSGLLTKKENPDAKISTPFGSIGIRGTSLWGGTLGAEYGVYVDEGQINFDTNRGQMSVGPGQATSVTGINAIPARPKALPPEILAAAKSTVALRNLTQVRTRLAALREQHPGMIRAHRDFVRDMQQRRMENHSPEGGIRPHQPGMNTPNQHPIKERMDNRMNHRMDRRENGAPAGRPGQRGELNQNRQQWQQRERPAQRMMPAAARTRHP